MSRPSNRKRQSNSQLARLVYRAQRDWVFAVRWLFGVDPTQQQKQLLYAMSQPGARVSVRSGHGVGKTCVEAWCILIHTGLFHDCRCYATAPSSAQLRAGLWAEVGKWHAMMQPVIRETLVYTTQRLYAPGRPDEPPRFAEPRTARKEQPEALQGLHATHTMIIVDEGSAVHDKIFEAGQGSMSTPGARMLMCSNPTRLSGYFYDSHHKNRHSWDAFHMSCLDSPRVTKKYIRDITMDYGIGSIMYAVRVAGDFPDRSDDMLIPLDLIEAAMERTTVVPEGEYRRLGQDVAYKGADYSTHVLRAGPVVTYMDRWAGHDTVESAKKTMSLWQRNQFDAAYVDVIGFGAGVYDALKHSDVPCIPVDVGRKATVPRYALLRDELWFRTRRWFQQDDCSIPPERGEGVTQRQAMLTKTLLKELSEITYGFKGNKMKVAGKEELKKEHGWSPDMGDGLMMTFADDEQAPERMPEEEGDPKPALPDVHEDWLAGLAS